MIKDLKLIALTVWNQYMHTCYMLCLQSKGPFSHEIPQLLQSNHAKL